MQDLILTRLRGRNSLLSSVRVKRRVWILVAALAACAVTAIAVFEGLLVTLRYALSWFVEYLYKINYGGR
jgi:hypothetical protein